MKDLNKVKKFILVPLLILNLAAFNFSALPAFAEEGEPGVPCPPEEDPICNQEGDGGEGGESVVETGDVDVEVNMENDVNTNIVETEEEESQSEDITTEETTTTTEETLTEESTTTEEIMPLEEATSTDETTTTTEEIATSTEEISEGGETDLEVVNENEALIENNAQAEGESGANTVSSGGDAIIDTGDVNIVFGLINTANTNLIESDFNQLLLNINENLEGDVDLQNKLNEATSSDQGECCFDLNASNTNIGEIDNEVLIEGSSGENSAKSKSGIAYINTGDVNVSANIFNLLNTNIIGSNWTNLVINVFDNWAGDLVLPGKEKMEEYMNNAGSTDLCQGECGSLTVNNSNEGEIENEIYIESNTGNNEAKGGSSIIRTGNASARTNVLNIANTNAVNNNLFFMAVNVFGKWQGNIFSLPSWFNMGSDGNGIKIFNMDSEEFSNHGGSGSLKVISDNQGKIKNGVVINVSTGNNSAQSENGGAIIDTGNANASANLINILNSNLINSNWLTGVINIFGDWEGDIAFGRPDLWIGESVVTAPNPAKPGGEITYTLTYTNKGNADATGVSIIDDFDEEFLSVVDPRGGFVHPNPGEISWNLGTVPVGESRSVSYTARIASDIPYGSTQLTNTATINGVEEDANGNDNTETLSIEVSNPVPIWQPNLEKNLPDLRITKTNNASSSINPGTEGVNIDYKIVLTNEGDGSAYNVVVNDVFQNSSYEEITKNSWDLGQVFSKEEIIINYTVFIRPDIPDGFYTNTAQATGIYGWGGNYSTNFVNSVIEIRRPESTSTKEAIEEVEEEEAEETEGTMSLEDIEKSIGEIQGAIEKIREEIERMMPTVPQEEFSVLETVRDILIQEVSAQEGVNLSETGMEKPEVSKEPMIMGQTATEIFLAQIDNFFMNLGLKNILLILILSIVIFAIISYSSRKRGKVVS